MSREAAAGVMVGSEMSNACRRFAALKWTHLSPGACVPGYRLPPLRGWVDARLGTAHNPVTELTF